MPLGVLEKVHEVDAECLVRLTQLPILEPAVAFQFLTEPSHLIGDGLVGCLARQEPPHPAHEVGRRRRPNQRGVEQELAVRLQ